MLIKARVSARELICPGASAAGVPHRALVRAPLRFHRAEAKNTSAYS